MKGSKAVLPADPIEATLDADNWDDGCRRLDDSQARELNRRRDETMARCLSLGAKTFNGNQSKLYWGEMSAACLACAQGEWSCLYITRTCRLSCFYCPRDQGDPTSLPYDALTRTPMPSPEHYARLIEALGYRAVGMSGGEPFQHFERLVRYTATLRKRLGDALTLCAYSGGDGVDARRVGILVNAGLDELRIDLTARGYALSLLRSAKAVGTLSVEFPMIPEDRDRVQALLPVLERYGVRHVNLHQLSCTPLNAPKLAARGYTVSRGYDAERPVVESELAALEVLAWAARRRIGLSVQYCSLHYKRRFQGRSPGLRLTYFRQRSPDAIEPRFEAAASGLRRTLEIGSDHQRYASYWRYSPVTSRALLEGRLERFSVDGAIDFYVSRLGPIGLVRLSPQRRRELAALKEGASPHPRSAFYGLESLRRDLPPYR